MAGAPRMKTTGRVNPPDLPKPKRKKAKEGSESVNGNALHGPIGRLGVDNAVWSACDVLRRSNCAGALQYVPELTWLLFLRVLDDREEIEAEEAKAVGSEFVPALAPPYRWRDWAAPEGKQRNKLVEGASGNFLAFVNRKLLPHLKRLKTKPDATPRQKVISEILTGTDRTRVDTERNLLDVLDRVHAINSKAIDHTHVFTLSQVYEGLLLRMGDKSNDGGQFFTPREVIRAIVDVIDPKPSDTIYDPCCGTGGFLIEAFTHMRASLALRATTSEIEAMGARRLYGREKENLIFPIALANLALHGIDAPNLWHGNALTGAEQYAGLWHDTPALFDVVLTNPPFGGKEGADAQTNFVFKTGATQVLFLQHVIDSLKPNGRCGMVVDEGVLFRTNEKAYVQTKRKLLEACNLWCVVSLPSGAFTAAGASVKTNLLFFTRGQPTEKIWYYDLSDLKLTKRQPLNRAHFDEFFALLPKRANSDRSWTVTREEIERRNFDLRADNPNKKRTVDSRTPAEIVARIEQLGRDADDAIAKLKRLLK